MRTCLVSGSSASVVDVDARCGVDCGLMRGARRRPVHSRVQTLRGVPDARRG